MPFFPAKIVILAAILAAWAPFARAAETEKTPAEWVALLGADHLAERDAASAQLLSLGARARGEVAKALDSPDAEVKFRARELWKTLRWLVIPGADADITALVERRPGIDNAHWHEFVKKWGASSLGLLAQFRDDGEEQKEYTGGVRAVLEDVPALNTARYIAEATGTAEQESLNALLDDFPQAALPAKAAGSWMEVEIALWKYDKAFDLGHEIAFRIDDENIVSQSAIAADRGGMLDRVEQNARDELKAEKDPARICSELNFYAGVFAALRAGGLIPSLCDLGAGAGRATDGALRPVVKRLFELRMPGSVARILGSSDTPLTVYMRSVAYDRMGDVAAAKADWQKAENGLDALKPEEKQETCYNLGETMKDLDDGRAGRIWEDLVGSEPRDSVYVANACFRLAEIAEARNEYAQAADWFEKGLAASKKLNGGILVATGDDSVASDPTGYLEEEIKRLRALAAFPKE